MSFRNIPLSILDLVPRSQDMTPTRAIEHSTELAVLADGLGYNRFWMAEHHGSVTFMSSATSLLLGHMAERTSGIRLGSGGVMLPNHAPLMVAEYYGTLATMYGDRFDLGLGRAPGTDPRTAAALRRGDAELNSFASDVADLVALLGDGIHDARGNRGVRAIPGEGTRVPLWMLGSSLGGAEVAGALGLPFSFASHFAPDLIDQAIAHYRERFDPSAPTAQVDHPVVMAGINVLVAPTDEEAQFLSSTATLMAIRIRTGQLAPLDPPTEDLDQVVAPELLPLAQAHHAARAVGSPQTVRADLEKFLDAHQVDELITVTYTFDPALRQRSYELLAQAWELSPRSA